MGPALLLIDIQDGIGWEGRNNPDAEQQAARLLAAWRETGRPVIHVRHLSTEPASLLRPELPGSAIKQVVSPLEREPVVEKQVNSAFIGTGLEERLRSEGVDKVVIAGLTSDHCVSATARMAGDLGFDAYVVADATATFDRTGPDGEHLPAEQVHAVSLATLDGEFATVVKTEEVLAGGPA